MLRPETEEKWRNLVDMLPEWTSRVRHPAQFWPQFLALVREIEIECTRRELPELRRRIEELVEKLGPVSHEDVPSTSIGTQSTALASGGLAMRRTPQEILESANAEMAAGNPEGFLAHCTDDIRWEMVGDTVLVGKAAVMAWARSTYAVAPPKFTADQWIVENDWLAVHGEITVEDAHRGPIHSRYCDLWRIQDGKLAELRAFAIEVSGDS